MVRNVIPTDRRFNFDVIELTFHIDRINNRNSRIIKLKCVERGTDRIYNAVFSTGEVSSIVGLLMNTSVNLFTKQKYSTRSSIVPIVDEITQYLPDEFPDTDSLIRYESKMEIGMYAISQDGLIREILPTLVPASHLKQFVMRETIYGTIRKTVPANDTGILYKEHHGFKSRIVLEDHELCHFDIYFSAKALSELYRIYEDIMYNGHNLFLDDDHLKEINYVGGKN